MIFEKYNEMTSEKIEHRTNMVFLGVFILAIIMIVVALWANYY